MANTMASWTRAAFPDVVNGFPGSHKELADQTTSTAAQTLIAPSRFFRAVISLKTYVLGTDTTGPVFRIRGATVFAMTTTLTIIGGTIAQLVASATSPQCFTIGGIAPVTALGFMDVTVAFSGTGSAVYDVILDAV